MTDPNSMLVWWPKIKDLGIPVPRTELIPIDRENVLEALDGAYPLHAHTVEAINNAAHSFGYPVFLRTDLASGKHDWKNTCFVPSCGPLSEHILAVCEANEMWALIGLNYQAIAVREFLELDTAFLAFSGNMPINKEFRFFVRDGKVVCYHFYWPEDAFNQHHARLAHDSDWKAKLRSLSELLLPEFLDLKEYAEKAGAALGGFWSIDFAKTKNGIWYLIDMALGKNSYHWPGCPNG